MSRIDSLRRGRVCAEYDVSTTAANTGPRKPLHALSALILSGILALAAVGDSQAQTPDAEAGEAVSEASPIAAGATDAAADIEAEGPVAEAEGDLAVEPPMSERERQGLETIVVSAERRSSDLQKVPAAVSAFSGNDLLERGLTNFNTLQYNVPGLFSGGGLTKITLRGVGSEIVGPGVDPGFAVHVNNVFTARETTGLLDYFDVERVDVLRGPQGTLWGRNSTGGAMNILTRRPEFEFDANGDLEYGRFEGGSSGLRIRGMLNMPLVDNKLALRVALLTNFNDGTMQVNSPGHQQRLNDAGAGTVRASLRWLPTNDLTIDVIGSYFRAKGAGPGVKFEGSYCPFGDISPSDPCTPPSLGEGPIVNATWPGAGPGADFNGALPNPESPYRGTADEPQRQEAEVWTATILAEWARDSWKLDSITGYQNTDYFLHRDQDTSSLPISTLDLTDKSMQVSQEFLFSSTWDKPFDYTLGTTYQYDHTPRTQAYIPNLQNTNESVNWLLYPALGPSAFTGDGVSLVDGCPIPPGLLGPYDPACPPIKAAGEIREDFINAKAEATNHIFGLFGHLTWRPIDALKLTAGGRYSMTHRKWNDESFSQTYAPALATSGVQVLQFGQVQEHTWNSGTWKFSADYQVTDEHLIWSSVGTGSRAGGFNFSEEQPFGAERILAVEAGTKSSFFDNRFTLNLTGFWYDWDNPQIAATENALPVVENAPGARSYGVELEWRALPVDELALNGSFGWQDAFYVGDYFSRDNSDPDWSNPDIITRNKMHNLNGHRMPRTPRFTVSVGAQYTFDFERFGKLTPRIDTYYRDRFSFRQYNNPKDVQPRYTRTDMRLTWYSQSDQYWIELFARNLENNAIKTNQELSSGIYRLHYYDAPINGGVRFGYYFR